MIGILGAMPQEIEQLRHAVVSPREERRGMRDYIVGKLAGREVVLAFSRLGKTAAAATATAMIEVFGVTSVLFTGVAGKIAPRLTIGDVVVATELVQHDMDVSALADLKLKRFEVPLLHRANFVSDPKQVAAATRAAEHYLADGFRRDIEATELESFGIDRPKVHAGLIVSGDQFIASPAQASRILAALPEALCVEMEGAAVAQVCYEYDVPMVVVRIISDDADHDASATFGRFVDGIASRFTAGIVMEMLATP